MSQITSTVGRSSPFGTAALHAAGGRANVPAALDPVDPSNPLGDATSQEYRELQTLKERDREVRRHEQAHAAAGGAYVKGGASYTYERGPDGKLYAVGGEVQIDTSPIPGDPAATIRKLEAVQRAANAPAEPSGQDRAVAAATAQALAEARTELREQHADANDQPSSAPAPRARQALSAYQGTAADTGAARPPLLDLTA